MKWRNLDIYLATLPTLKNNVFVSGVEPALHSRLKFLLSFHYYRKIDLEKAFPHPRPRLMADSGAFSAYSLGASIDIHEYAAWIKRWKHLFDSYANLDVIGSAQETLDNQHRLEDMGLHPLPVFHVGEPWEYLERYLEKYNYIALGGMAAYSISRKRKLIPWIIKAFKMLGVGQGYHGFGTTGWVIMKSFPWWSVDSSSWSSVVAYGHGHVFSITKGLFQFAICNVRSCFNVRHDLTRLGFHWEDFAKPTDDPLFGQHSVVRQKLLTLGAKSFIEAEMWLSRRHANGSIKHIDPLSAGSGAYQKLLQVGGADG